MLSINVSVMDLVTGNEFWTTLPVSNIKMATRGLDPDNTLISDTEEDLPFNLGGDVSKVNEALLKCEDAGLNSVDEIYALMTAAGEDTLTGAPFLDVLDSGDFRQYAIKAEWPKMTDEQCAACWLATEQYIPFGDLEIGDLVPVEDKLIDFIDWDEVWDDYVSKGFSLTQLRDNSIIVTQII